MLEMGRSELCQQPDYGLSCGGCCGFIYETRKSRIPEFIKANTDNFRKYLLKHDNEKSRYFRRMSRHPDHNLCEYLIFLDKNESTIGCAGHPAINGIDYRENIIDCMPGNCPNSHRLGSLDESHKIKVLERLQKKYGWDPIMFSRDMSTEKIKI